MSITKLPKEMQTIIAYLKRLPGVGEKTAERFIFQIFNWKQEELDDLCKVLSTLKEEVMVCEICGCLKTKHIPCDFCDISKRDTTSLCIVSSPKEVLSIETTSAFKGLYHVIEKLLSPLEGYGAEVLRLDKLEKRLNSHQIKEVIIALDSTLEGDATALFLKKQFEDRGIRTTRLAYGLPVGSSLEYIDGGTLKQALLGRQNF